MAPLEEGLQVLVLICIPLASPPCSVTLSRAILHFCNLVYPFLTTIAHLFVIPD